MYTTFSITSLLNDNVYIPYVFTHCVSLINVIICRSISTVQSGKSEPQNHVATVRKRCMLGIQRTCSSLEIFVNNSRQLHVAVYRVAVNYFSEKHKRTWDGTEQLLFL